ncbi:MAG: hypothetical protein WAR37_01555 [Candidatus Microsaccharimonas sp.]
MKPLIRAFGATFGILRAEYRQITNRYFAPIERFPGNAREIAEQVLSRLWYGDFYRTSLGHFNFFWMRDFGTVAESLVHLNQTTHVHHTLRWALRHYRRAGRVKLCVDKSGNVFNAPGKPSIDALPWLLHSILVSRYTLNKDERTFLNKEIEYYVKKFLTETGDIKKGLLFAEMRDAVYYDRSAYAVALVGRMAYCAKMLELKYFPFAPLVYSELLKTEYWTGDFFKADRTSTNYSSDSALIPFFLKVVDDEYLAGRTLDYINKVELNKPYPLKYGEKPSKRLHYRFGMGPISMPNYSETSIWTWQGTYYLHLLQRYDRPEYSDQYANFCTLIERHGTYPELLNPDGSWYYAPFYRGDPGMVWAALFLELPDKQ